MASPGASLEVLVDGSGPAIVFLPSSQRDSLHDGAFARQLAAAGYTVLRPQPRGMAGSHGPLDGISLYDLADDVAAVIDRLAGGRAALLGHAFGHYIARVTDLRHPDKVRAVVVLGAAARVFPPGLTEALDCAADPLQPPALRLAALRKAMFAPDSDASVWLSGWYPQLRAAYRRVGSVPDKSVWWPVAHAPLLDLQAAHDPWRPPQSRNELRDVLGDRVTVQVIEGASHALIPEQPGRIVAAVAQWLDAQPA